MNIGFLGPAVATVLTACGIETWKFFYRLFNFSICQVATVLTACGIETCDNHRSMFPSYLGCNSTYRLRYWNYSVWVCGIKTPLMRCNSTYRLRYWNYSPPAKLLVPAAVCCNSTYRLRYWNSTLISSKALFNSVATVLTVYGIETLQQYERYRSLVLVGIKFTIYGIWQRLRSYSAMVRPQPF